MSNNSYSSYREGNKTEQKSSKSKQKSGNKSTESKNRAAVQNSKSARRLSPPEQAPQKETQRPAKQNRKAEQKRQKQERARYKQEQKTIKKASRDESLRLFKERLFDLFKKAFFAILVLVLIGETILMLSQNAGIDALKFEINDLNTQYEKENNVLKELNSQKETALKSETIENIARYNLGMVYPTKEQTIYINLD